MSRTSARNKHMIERSSKVGLKEKEKPNQKKSNIYNNSVIFKHLKKVYPLGIQRSNSLLSVSSLSLSQTSTDSSLSTDYYSCPLDKKILSSLESLRKATTTAATASLLEEETPPVVVATSNDHFVECDNSLNKSSGDREIKRCHWITRNSDKVYVSFHDEQWGVPVYDDHQLFELLSLSGMLMDYNWTEILKRRSQLREAFGGFDVNFVANMGENYILEVCSNKELGLAECRARCIVENARGIIKVTKEYGSFSSYIWGYFNYRPIINKYRYPRNVPLRSPKAEVISKDLVRLGFRLVGPVITQSFIQVAGMSIDHLVDCFRYNDCVSLAENPWRHV